jgi:hypothetical protein
MAVVFGGVALKDCAALSAAVESFVRSNCNIRASAPIVSALEALGECTKLEDAFTLLIQRQLLDFEAAISWALFLNAAPARAVELGDASFSVGAPFSLSESLSMITTLYDIAMEELLDDHFDDEDEEDEDQPMSG